jgi:hypothetical protein
VLNILRRHYARYTPEMVASICGCSTEQCLDVAEQLMANSGRERTSAIVYAVGWTQHSTGPEMIRASVFARIANRAAMLYQCLTHSRWLLKAWYGDVVRAVHHVQRGSECRRLSTRRGQDTQRPSACARTSGLDHGLFALGRPAHVPPRPERSVGCHPFGCVRARCVHREVAHSPRDGLYLPYSSPSMHRAPFPAVGVVPHAIAQRSTSGEWVRHAPR